MDALNKTMTSFASFANETFGIVSEHTYLYYWPHGILLKFDALVVLAT